MFIFWANKQEFKIHFNTVYKTNEKTMDYDFWLIKAEQI